MSILNKLKNVTKKIVAKVKTVFTSHKVRVLSQQLHQQEQQLHQQEQQLHQLQQQLRQLEQVKREQEKIFKRKIQKRDKKIKRQGEIIEKETTYNLKYFWNKPIKRMIEYVDNNPSKVSDDLRERVTHISNKIKSTKRYFNDWLVDNKINDQTSHIAINKLLISKKIDNNPFTTHLFKEYVKQRKKVTTKEVDRFYHNLSKYKLKEWKGAIEIEQANTKITSQRSVNDKGLKLVFRLYPVDYDWIIEEKKEGFDPGSLSFIYDTIDTNPNLVEVRYEDTTIKIAHLDKRGYEVLHRLFLNFDYLTTDKRIESTYKTVKEIYDIMSKWYEETKMKIHLFDYQLALNMLKTLKQKRTTIDQIKKDPLYKAHRLSFQKVDISTKKSKI